MMYLAGRSKPGVITVSPGCIGESASQAPRSRSAPAALKMAPHTPPPSRRSVLAALTMASALIFVISCLTIMNGMAVST